MGIGFLSSGGDGEAFGRRGLAVGLSFWQSFARLSPRSGSHAFGSHAVNVPGFACIRSAWRPAWFGLMRIFPPFPPHRACRKFFVLSSWFLVIAA